MVRGGDAVLQLLHDKKLQTQAHGLYRRHIGLGHAADHKIFTAHLHQSLVHQAVQGGAQRGAADGQGLGQPLLNQRLLGL